MRILLAAGLIAAPAGCGGGGSPTPKGPAPPLQLQASARTSNSPSPVALSWTSPQDTSVVEYGVYRRFLGESIYSKIAVVPASQTSYVDALATTDRYKDIYYQVVSIDSKGVESQPAGPIFSDAPPPPPPG